MRKNLLIFATLFLALSAAVYAELRYSPSAPQAAPAAAAVPGAPFAASVCCTRSTAEASGEVTMVEVEMTPIVERAPEKAAGRKSDERFANYALENAASGWYLSP
jgi:hypothetical protein